MILTLGYSPCPNDTFIFEALALGKIKVPGVELQVVLEDVQTLNEWALQGRLDICKISYGALPQLLDTYAVLSSGGAIGRGVGPLLVASTPPPFAEDAGFDQKTAAIAQALLQYKVAIPGANTTAHFLLQSLFATVPHKEFLRYDLIEDFAARPQCAGVIIHENRFTYAQKGLYAWLDMGLAWETVQGLPIPLGGIVAKRTLPAGIVQALQQAIQQSLALSWQQYPHISPYIQCHAQAMDTDTMRRHIELYVNDFTTSAGSEGTQAVVALLQTQGLVLSEKDVFFQYPNA
jgi:1,4-dihydroxy-6-naphthoate synthase